MFDGPLYKLPWPFKCLYRAPEQLLRKFRNPIWTSCLICLSVLYEMSRILSNSRQQRRLWMLVVTGLVSALLYTNLSNSFQKFDCSELMIRGIDLPRQPARRQVLPTLPEDKPKPMMQLGPSENVLDDSPVCHETTPNPNVTKRVRPPKALQVRNLWRGPGLSQVEDVFATRETARLLQTNSTESVCEILHSGLSGHFPHAMQQLYRCWSWFQWSKQQNSNITDFMLIGEYSFPGFRRDKIPHNVRLVVKALQEALRFQVITNATKEQFRNRSVYIEGEKGPYPYGMLDPEHARALSREMVQYFAPQLLIQDNRCKTKNSPPRVAILNRNATTAKRSLLNADYLAIRLEQELAQLFPNAHDISVPVVYFENKSFVEQLSFFAANDLVLSPHGAQITTSIFMAVRPCRALMEIFPVGYYYPHFFGSLMDAADLGHYSVYAGTGGWEEDNIKYMKTIEGRKVARGANLCLSTDHVAQAVRLMVQEWRKCCKTVLETKTE